MPKTKCSPRSGKPARRGLLQLHLAPPRGCPWVGDGISAYPVCGVLGGGPTTAIVLFSFDNNAVCWRCPLRSYSVFAHFKGCWRHRGPILD